MQGFLFLIHPTYLDCRTDQSEGVHWITHRIFEDNDHAPKSKIRSVKLSYRNMRFIKRHCWIYRKVLLWNRGTFLEFNEYRCVSATKIKSAVWNRVWVTFNFNMKLLHIVY